MRTPPPVAGDPKLATAIRELSRLKYGRPQRQVEAEIYANLKLGSSSAAPAAAAKTSPLSRRPLTPNPSPSRERVVSRGPGEGGCRLPLIFCVRYATINMSTISFT